MPPIQKISKEMILNSGIEIVRGEGIENLNVRNIAKKLNCSTQPIMYHYKNMDLLKEELYSLTDNYHSEFLKKGNNQNNPLLNIGLQYIKFASEESNLFKFLFQSNKFANSNFEQLTNCDGVEFILNEIQREANITKVKAKELFENIFISAHGIASLIANNSMKYDEIYCIKILKSAFLGSLIKIKDIKEE
ncbi:MAG: TetR/AcrR family transcriptional regulator [Bacilli bacterium]|nr:TetR/AcrR family transcriptional regulator [Bacilli bacterium]